MIIFKIWCLTPLIEGREKSTRKMIFLKDELHYLVTREYLETFLVESMVSPLVLMMLYH